MLDCRRRRRHFLPLTSQWYANWTESNQVMGIVTLVKLQSLLNIKNVPISVSLSHPLTRVHAFAITHAPISSCERVNVHDTMRYGNIRNANRVEDVNDIERNTLPHVLSFRFGLREIDETNDSHTTTTQNVCLCVCLCIYIWTSTENMSTDSIARMNEKHINVFTREALTTHIRLHANFTTRRWSMTFLFLSLIPSPLLHIYSTLALWPCTY